MPAHCSFMLALPVLLIRYAHMNPNKFLGTQLLRKSLYSTGSFQSLEPWDSFLFHKLFWGQVSYLILNFVCNTGRRAKYLNYNHASYKYLCGYVEGEAITKKLLSDFRECAPVVYLPSHSHTYLFHHASVRLTAYFCCVTRCLKNEEECILQS